MKEITKDGLILCDMQGKIFENSLNENCSSEIFIRRFVYSTIAYSFDNYGILNSIITIDEIAKKINEEFGLSSYGKVKYAREELYWIGYIYRYFCFTYELSTKMAYKIIKPKELRGLFYPYHSLDPKQAVSRILESKNIYYDEKRQMERDMEILKETRNNFDDK